MEPRRALRGQAKFNRDQQIISDAQQEGATIDTLTAKWRLHWSSIYDIVNKAHVRIGTTKERQMAQNPTVLGLLKEHADDRGSVRELTIPQMVRLSGLDHHDVVKTLWQLRQMGLLGFGEERHGKQTAIRAIRLTKSGLRSSLSGMSHAAGNQPPVESLTAIPAEEIILPEHWDNPWTEQGSNNYVDPDLGPLVLMPEPEPESTPQPVVLPFPNPPRLPAPLADYPLIEALVGRRERLAEAARLLEQAGQMDLATRTLMALDEAPTPLEAEVLRFLAALPSGPA